MVYTCLSANQIGDCFALLNSRSVLYSFYNDREEYKQQKVLDRSNLDVTTILVDPFGKYVLLYGKDAVYIFWLHRKSAGYPCLFYKATIAVE